MRYVYADIFFLVNFCFDFSLLYLAGRLARSAVAGRRVAVGAAVGALFGVAALYPQLAFLMSLPAKVVVSALMVVLAYPATARNLRLFANTLALFYVSSFSVGGAALAWNYLVTGTASLYGGLAAGSLGLGAVVPAVLVGGVLLHWAFVTGKERQRVAAFCVPCRVEVEGNQVEFRGLVDTGNRLRDPLSNDPVLIVDYPALGRLLPPGLLAVWRGGGGREGWAVGGEDEAEEAATGTDDPDLGRLTEALGGTAWLARVRLIPFSSLGRANGLLVGFRPDAVIVGRGERSVRRTDVVVCVSPRPLSPEGGYRALVPPEILEDQAVA